MKILLSINYKFFKVKPKKFIELVKKFDKDNLINGFEIATASEEDENYVKELAEISQREGYIINLHSPLLQGEEYKKYLEFVIEISNITKRKVNIVFHPINAENLEKSEKMTYQYIKELNKYILEKNYNDYLELSLENLNDINGIKRLKKENLITILKEEKNLKFTYDIGHEIIDGVQPKELPSILLKRINNIHVHTYNGILDHYPIESFEENDTKHIQEILEKLVNYGYDENIVMEYAIDYIDGNSFEEKLENYIKYAELLKARVL